MSSTKSDYKLILTMADLDLLISRCKATGYASVDFETTGFEYYQGHQYPLILGVSYQPGSRWIIPLQHKDSPLKDKWVPFFTKFGKEVIENHDVIKVGWNFKFEYKWFMQYGIWPRGRLFDAMLAKYCLDEERPNGLKEFVAKCFPVFAGYEQKMVISEQGEEQKTDWKNTNFDTLCEYCGLDCDLTLRSMIIMEPKLINGGFYSLFRNMLCMIMRVLAESEFYGLMVDKKYLMELIAQYKIKIEVCQKKLQDTPSLLKFEKKNKRRQLRRLIKNVELEIRELTREDADENSRKIQNREKKIKGFLEGKFNSKERKKLEPINFNSPDQLKEFLFLSPYGLELPIIKYTKDKKTKKNTDNPSTDEETLLQLKKKDKSGFMKNLLDLRGLVKLNSTYIQGIWDKLDQDSLIHTNFKINGTVTGRLSSVEPNMQNIPRDTTAADIKRMFVPRPGYVFGEVDYSQAELRIIAEVSGDKAMIEIFKKNYNPHVATACKMFGGIEQYDKVKAIIKIADGMGGKELEKKENKLYLKWAKRKKKGKSMNFSVLYQQGPPAMAKTLKTSIEEAKKFQKIWFSEYPGISKWIKKQKVLALKHGYVRNIFGGKRRLYNIDSDNFGKRSEAERQAVNAPIQGGSGYFTLFSMVVIREKIMRGELPRDLISLLTVHDSIKYLMQPKHIHKVMPTIVEVCNNPETLKYFGFQLKHVRMKVSGEIGIHWALMKPYEPEIKYENLLADYNTLIIK